MRIALFNTMTPYVRGGAEILVDDLKTQLEKRGHSVTLFRIPFPNNFELSLMNTIYAAKSLNFDSYDAVIAFKFPAYCAVHRNKVLWMFHQFRQVYELFGLEYGIADIPEGRAVRHFVEIADSKGIGHANKVFTNAAEVTNRLKRFNNIGSTILNPPLEDYETYFCGENGDYIYYPSRITNFKRQLLAVQAMKYVRTDVKLVIHGKCEQPGYYEQIQKEIKDNHLNNVTVEDRWVSNEEKKNVMADSLAVMYIPYKEDSCGFVTMEGFYSKKPVISCTDSGGTVEFIDDGKTGFFVEPDPKKLAEVMDKLFLDKKKARDMGLAAYDEIIRRDITWDKTIRRLLECE